MIDKHIKWSVNLIISILIAHQIILGIIKKLEDFKIDDFIITFYSKIYEILILK